MALNPGNPLTTAHLPLEFLPGLPNRFPDKVTARSFFRPFREVAGNRYDGSESATNLLWVLEGSARSPFGRAKFISYEALPGELQLAEFNKRWAKHLYFPFYSFTNGLVSEPLFRDAAGRVFRPEEINTSFMLVPALAVAFDGARLGQGGGWYDRAIARLLVNNPDLTVVGCVPSPFLIPPGILPIERHDQRMDMIITESSSFLPTLD